MSTLDEVSFESRIRELDEEKTQRLAEKGYLPLYKFAQGETVFELTQTKPRKSEMNGTVKTVYRIKVSGQEYDVVFAASIERKIVEAYLNKQTKFTIIRLGEGQKTRYSLKE
jgi:hypothetical protein